MKLSRSSGHGERKKWAQFHRAAKAQKVAKHDNIMLTRIRLPAKLPCYIQDLNPAFFCQVLKVEKSFKNIFCFIKAAQRNWAQCLLFNVSAPFI